jgi:hypothetical protein
LGVGTRGAVSVMGGERRPAATDPEARGAYNVAAEPLLGPRSSRTCSRQCGPLRVRELRTGVGRVNP